MLAQFLFKAMVLTCNIDLFVQHAAFILKILRFLAGRHLTCSGFSQLVLH